MKSKYAAKISTHSLRNMCDLGERKKEKCFEMSDNIILHLTMKVQGLGHHRLESMQGWKSIVDLKRKQKQGEERRSSIQLIAGTAEDYMIFFKVRQAEKQCKTIRKEKGTRGVSYIADINAMLHTQSEGSFWLIFEAASVNNHESLFLNLINH